MEVDFWRGGIFLHENVTIFEALFLMNFVEDMDSLSPLKKIILDFK